MNIYKPIWAEKYIELGFSKNWIDDVITKHGSELPKQLGESLNPSNFYDIDLLNMEKNPKLIQNINIPNGYTLSEVILLVLDCLDSFGKHTPREDSEIYELYNKLPHDMTIEFDEFYAFIRRVQYTDIKEIPQYKLLDKTVEYYVLKTIPIIDSIWIVPYKDGLMKVKVMDLNENSDFKLYDSTIHVKIIDIIKPINKDYIRKQSTLNLRPYEFNNGIQI